MIIEYTLHTTSPEDVVLTKFPTIVSGAFLCYMSGSNSTENTIIPINISSVTFDTDKLNVMFPPEFKEF